MQMRSVVALLSVLAVAVGCDESESDPAEMGPFDARVFDVGGGGMGGGGGGPTEEHLRLSYIKTVQPRDGRPAVIDMVIYDFEDDEEYNLTGGEGIVDCATNICRLNEDMNAIGWLERDPAGAGFKLWVAPVDVVRKEVLTDDRREIDEGVTAFEFTTFTADSTDPESPRVELVVYSKAGSGEELDVWAEPVVAPDAGTCDAGEPLPACRGLVGTINGAGGFRVTNLGSLVILITTTLSTMTLEFFNVANGLQTTIDTLGEQGMTGSQFDGQQPIGLSPDARYLAVFTKNEQVWEVNTLQARPSPPPPETHQLFERDNSPNACVRAMPYNFIEVRFDPVFSEDSEWIYFLARGDCSRQQSNDTPTNRDDFDILRINSALEGPVENVTRNLRVSHWSNHDIGDFDLSPDGTKVAFTAQRPNQASSRSIWLLDPETGDYDCSRRAELEDDRDPDRVRCEFIADDRAGADVTLRDLQFHTVQVPVGQ